MSLYNRKGGSGKAGSLREQFNYYKRQVQNRLIQEQAFKLARGVGTIEGRILTLFKNIDFMQVYEHGITRKVGSHTVRYVGDEAIKVQIQSFRRRASKSYQAEIFIDNFCKAMSSKDYPWYYIEEARELLRSISIDKLAYFIDSGFIKRPPYIYAGLQTPDEFIEDLRKVIQTGITKEEIDELKRRKKQLVKVVKEQYKIMNW